MDIRLLGAVDIRKNGTSVVPSAPKPRQLLILLAMRRGRPVDIATIVDELWGDRVPRSAASTLQTYVMQLRHAISRTLADERKETAKSLLVTCHGAYMLNPGDGFSDVVEFEDLLSSGNKYFDCGDYSAAARDLDRALDLWRGSPLMGVQHGDSLALDVVALEEARLQALERRGTAYLHLGRNSQLIRELRRLVREQPMHETFSFQLMVALHRSGNTWRAVEEYSRLRHTLAEELGINPSPRLRRLHQAILSDGRVPVP
ncbi:AfsR/SARP family transcriptional regulator [Streptomyces sp. DSM 44917]|uniref:AfsR/SARP family transcriptional regulator n=1 Tax=Streptomyces boetiae TaxID=3075541 RepID=A0ABU2L4L4_9ACTN|nr:AfsR/SARP family transcriptional regulator [Streptomyces sp. DSM 44917]MDT0306499.1 AfsR/SARP family transcriptional regulator [Streptomyces sp. DSM 44917]